MNPDDVVILIDPFKSELEKIKQTLVDGVGLKVFAVCDEDTIFPTIKVPPSLASPAASSCDENRRGMQEAEGGELGNYVYLAAGWNLLVETGVFLGINLDKPQRARKVGNEFIG